MMARSARIAALCALGLICAAAANAGVHAAQAANEAGLQGETSANFGCMACTIVLGLLIEKPANSTAGMAAEHPSTQVAQVVRSGEALRACAGDAECEEFVSSYGKELAEGLEAGSSPDDLCISFKLCDGTCTLFQQWPVAAPPPRPAPTPPHSSYDDDDYTAADRVSGMFESGDDEPLAPEAALRRVAAVLGTLRSDEFARATRAAPADFYGFTTTVLTTLSVAAQRAEGVAPAVGATPDPCGWNITCIVHRVFSQHLPLSDADGDTFPPSGDDRGFRGADWRGRDCNDTDPNVRPGRGSQLPGEDPNVDHNCNGISGVDAASGKSYEELWCEGTDRRGVTILGDSAAAHFDIPPSYLRHQKWSLKNLVPVAEDEADWPQCSWATGYVNTSSCLPSALPMDSLYQRLREHNLCIHRDFANIGVNGARTGSMMPDGKGGGIISSFRRDQEHDSPAVVIFALIGNDVCNGHLPDTLGHMTPPPQFYSNVVASFDYLDTVLPENSTVVIIPLVDGRVLWNIMHTQIHPLGVPYPWMYSYLNCYQTNPCSGWLNVNETLRNATSAWAASLNAEYAKIMANETLRAGWTHFDLIFEDLSWQSFIGESRPRRGPLLPPPCPPADAQRRPQRNT